MTKRKPSAVELYEVMDFCWFDFEEKEKEAIKEFTTIIDRRINER